MIGSRRGADRNLRRAAEGAAGSPGDERRYHMSRRRDATSTRRALDVVDGGPAGDGCP